MYILKWSFEEPREGIEKRTDYYSWENRAMCIKRYIDLKEQWYASDVRMLVAEPKEVNIDDILANL